MAGELIYAFRVMRLPLLDAGGAPIGRLDDIVVIPGRPGVAHECSASSPRASDGASSSTPAASAAIDSDGARLRSWDVDLNPFKPKPGEVLVGTRHHRQADRRRDRQRRRPARRQRRAPDLVGGRQGAPGHGAARCGAGRATGSSTATRCPSCFTPPAPRSPPRPPGCATCTRATSPASCGPCRSTQRKQLAEAMEDDRLADLLEELPGGRAAAHHRRPRPRAAGQRARGDGVRRRRRPAGRDARRAAHPGARRRWTPRTPTSCAACCPTTRAPPAR